MNWMQKVQIQRLNQYQAQRALEVIGHKRVIPQDCTEFKGTYQFSELQIKLEWQPRRPWTITIAGLQFIVDSPDEADFLNALDCISRNIPWTPQP
jgi:hypothetical protein